MAPILHVPAWKKLGLKLKFAKDIPIEGHEGSMSGNIGTAVIEDGDAGPKLERLGLETKEMKEMKETPSDNSQSAATMPNKRKRALLDDGGDLGSAASPPLKKTKKSQATALKRVADGLLESPAALRETPAASNINSVPSPTKRKSVSFTPETKTIDGDSIKQLYNIWLAEQAEDFDPQTSAEALRPVSPSSVGETREPPKVKKARKRKASKSTLVPPSVEPESGGQTSIADTQELGKTKTARHRDAPRSTLSPPSAGPGIATQASEPAHVPLYLQYLNEYHTSRSTWKFNKAKQTTLLKNVFDPIKIPPTYDLALRTYLSGLKGLAARARLRETAIEILNPNGEKSATDGNTMDDEERTVRAEQEARIAELLGVDPERVEKYNRRLQEDYKYAEDFHKKKLKGIQARREEYEKEHDPALGLLIAKRKRAELVLATFPSTVGNQSNPIALDDDDAADDGADANGRKKKKSRVPTHMRRARKRKNRTGVPDDDSTSGDTTSSDEETLKAPQASGSHETPAKKAKADGDTTSNSGTSSSDDDDDSSSNGSSSEEDSDAEESSEEKESSSHGGVKQGRLIGNSGLRRITIAELLAEETDDEADTDNEEDEDEEDKEAGPASAKQAKPAAADASSPTPGLSSSEKDRSSDEDYEAPAQSQARSKIQKGKGKATATATATATGKDKGKGKATAPMRRK